MKFKLVAVFVCFAIASTIASDEHRPKLKVKDDVRGKRNLEYQISHHYPIGANFRLERRISSGPPNFQLNSRFPTYYSGPRPHIHRGRPHSIPPYAVQMEPLVQYSQRDPLYDTSKLPLTAEGHNDLSKPSDDLLTDNNHLSENVYPQNFHSSSYGQHHNEPPVYYQKEPEPIIEIIIKESNVTLPPVPVPTLPPKKKEPVQVFYVKYKKNPNGYGKDSVIYDKPVPALTPHVQEDDHEEPQLDQPHQEYVTLPPPPSTTLRTIIRPDSETYIGTSGIHVTFGSENKKHTPHPEGHEESAPQPAVAFPQAQTQQQHSSQNNHNHHINQHHPLQQQTQFSQPIPERKPHTSAFPPNLNPPVNFNQQTFGSRPTHNNQPPQFAGTQYRPVHQQPARPFPQVLQNHQLRQPVAPPRNFQQQTFNHQRPISPPQLPTIPAQSKPAFNQFNPNHQTPSFPPNQFPPNQQFPPNHQFQFSQNQKPPQSQFPGFHQQFPPQSHKSQFSQILNQRPQTHFPVVQPQQQQQQFNHKPSNPIEQHKPTQHQQHNQQQLRVNQQQQNYQFHNQHSIQHHRTNTHQQQQSQPQPQQNLQHHPQQNHQVHQPQNHQLHQQQNHQIHQQQQNRQQHQQSNQQQLQQNHQQQNHHQHNQQQHQQNQQQQQQLHQQQQQQHLQQLQQSTPHVIPPGGELLKSVPRYEQHISIPAEPSSSQIRNNQGVSSQALPLQSQSQINHNVAKPGTQALNQFNQQSGQQSFQQLQAQLQQQLQQQQQQLNLQVQQQIKSDQLLQQQKTLSPLDFQQQIQQQFNFPLQNFAQLNNINNLQGKQVSQTTSAPKQNNIYTQQLLNQKTQSQQNYFNTQQSSQNSFFTQQNIPNIYQTSSQSLPSSTSAPKIIYQSTTSTTTTTTTSKPVEKTEEKKTNKLPPNIQLPDEVPDDLREQLLSSGILSNADISVLDYDKIGDIPIDALPPDQLANFYGAGGAQQLAASERRETFVKPDGQPVDSKDSMVNIDQELSAEESEIDEVKTFEPKQLEMKVVRYDSESEQGQSVQQSYVQDDATHVDPVVLNDNKYNRYLPLKVNGAQFPIPDVPELKGRNISSVVVLAPVDYEFHQEHHNERSARDIEGDIKDVRFRAGEALKQLIKEPTKDNYKMWLEKENQTATDKQSVILLVTGYPESEDKEIFMYDVATKSVSKLSGELSSAFVEAAETNANDELPALSEIHETKLETEDSDIVAKYIHSNHNNDLVMSARNL